MGYGIILINIIPRGAERSGIGGHSLSQSDYGIISYDIMPPGAEQSGIGGHSLKDKKVWEEVTPWTATIQLTKF